MNKSPPTCRGISVFYPICNHPGGFRKSPMMLKWEKDLTLSFSVAQWLAAFKANAKSSACVDHWDNAQKILHRYYMTPHRLNTIDKNMSPLCWRECRQAGNLLHVLWDCPIIHSLWKQIASIISTLTGSIYDINPALALLSVGIDQFRADCRTIIAHLLFATRITLAKHWRSTSPPTIGEIKHRVNYHYEMEKLLAYKEHKASSFHYKWDKWLTLSPDVD